MSNKSSNVVISAEISTLESEGKALSQEWKKICKADTKRFNASTKADGFDTRLGKLMLALKQEGGQRITSARLKDCNIHTIAKQRRSEALWFVENEDAARAFMKTSKKGFTSLSALQKAFNQSAKADEPKQPKADATPVEPEVDAKSDDGLNEPKVQSASDIAMEALIQCDTNGISVQEFLAALKEQIIMEERVAA